MNVLDFQYCCHGHHAHIRTSVQECGNQSNIAITHWWSYIEQHTCQSSFVRPRNKFHRDRANVQLHCTRSQCQRPDHQGFLNVKDMWRVVEPSFFLPRMLFKGCSGFLTFGVYSLSVRRNIKILFLVIQVQGFFDWRMSVYLRWRPLTKFWSLVINFLEETFPKV